MICLVGSLFWLDDLILYEEDFFVVVEIIFLLYCLWGMFFFWFIWDLLLVIWEGLVLLFCELFEGGCYVVFQSYFFVDYYEFLFVCVRVCFLVLG